MIRENEVLQLLIDTYPPSRKLFVERADEWVPEKNANGSVTPYPLFRIIIAHIVKDFVSGGYEYSQELFDLIERFIKEGDASLSNAACVGFVESFCNIASCGKEFEYGHFVALLGKESAKFARSWDSNVDNILGDEQYT